MSKCEFRVHLESICTPRYLVSNGIGISIPLILSLFLGVIIVLSVAHVNCIHTVFMGLKVSPMVVPHATS